jgi:predicted nucleic acid-binding protein
LKLLDTCFLIDLLRGETSAVQYAEELDGGATTTVNAYELFFGIEHGAMNREKRLLEAESLFERLEVLPLDYESSRSAARFMSDLYQKGEPVDALDVFTVSIGLKHGFNTVVTRNRSHFERFKHITVDIY